MSFPITSLYAAAFGILLLVLWLSVTRKRAASHISIGDGGDVDLHERIRKHGNFVEWVPLTVVLMALAEAQGAGGVWLHAAGLLALIGRLVHPFGLKADTPSHIARIIGNSGNILAMLLLIGLLVRGALA